MIETIDYASNPLRPAGSSPMPNKPTPQAAFRYTYGSGSRPLDGYTIKRAIGRGGFGEVYYATSDSGKEVALKLIKRNVEDERRGVAQCMNLKCPNLLTIFDIRGNDAGETFVVMEYVAGNSLAGVLDRYPTGMPENEIRVWLKGLVEGVDYLHDHGVIHRDLKPANLFMEEGIVKIGDYGLAKLISPQQGSEHSESIGTCYYMAPEISTGKYHKPIDIYAIGVILHEMLTGSVPFTGETVGEVLMKHLTTRPDLSHLPEPYRTVIGEALAKDPANRPKRAHDLLTGEDSPRVRDVRFIGEGKTVPPTEAAPQAAAAKPSPWPWRPRPAAHRPAEDDILRIGEVDPPFYIGPETRPPGAGLRAVAPVRPVTPIRPAPPRIARRVPRPAPAPAAPLPPPVQPPSPSARVRVGELAGSMFLATMLAGLAAYPAAAMLGIEPNAHPERPAFLFLLTTLATWGALIPAKLLEPTKFTPIARRLVGLAVGTLVGLAGAWLADWFKIGFHFSSRDPLFDNFGNAIGLVSWNSMIALPTYFGVAYLLNGWWKVADRDRCARLRVWPTLASAVIALGLTPLWPYRELWVMSAVPAAALLSQLVSPWDRKAAAYATYVRANPTAPTAA